MSDRPEALVFDAVRTPLMSSTGTTESAKYGERFEPPASLVERAERGEAYSDEQPAVAV